ncbi:MAG: AAA family ATPase [Blastocatellia bacterium]|nr:AAA family ATPase [Blastocatellia bacterium]
MTEPGFSPELLEKSPAERLEYFRAYTIAHPILKEVYTKLIQVIQEPAGVALVFIYGPTGVGKTTLRLRVEKHFKEEFGSGLDQKSGRIPIAGIEAIAPDSGNFSWKDYYKRTLLALEEPLVDYKIDYGARKVSRDGEGRLRIDQRIVSPDLRYALENALRYRQPAALLIDEAQHVTKIASGRKLQDQMDALKSLANESGTIQVLLGTYELLACRNLSAQLSRRSRDIHFRRYSTNLPDDVQVFQNIIFAFQRHLPVEQEPDLLTRWKYFYERSLGCVGILKDWLTRTLAVALDEASTSITQYHLESQALPLAQCKKIAREIMEGEAELTETPQDHRELCALLGLPLVSEERNDQRNQPGVASVEPGSKTIRKKSQPIRRNPKRDKVGN